MNFEEIITEHNDKLIDVFMNAGDATGHTISHALGLSQKIAALNSETEARIAEIFDKSFLDTLAQGETK